MTRLIAALVLLTLITPPASAGLFSRLRERRIERREQRQERRNPNGGGGGARLGGGVIPLEAGVSGVEGIKRPPGAVGFKLGDTTFEFIGRNGQSLGVFPRDEEDIKKAGGNKGALAGNGRPAPGGAKPNGGNAGGGGLDRAARPVPYDGNRFNATFAVRGNISGVENIPLPRGTTRYRLSDTQVQFLNARGQSLGIYARDEDDLKQKPASQNQFVRALGNSSGPASNSGGLPSAAPDSFASSGSGFDGGYQTAPTSFARQPYLNPFTNHVMRPIPQTGNAAPVNLPNNETHGDTGRTPAAQSTDAPKKRATAPQPSEPSSAPVLEPAKPNTR